MEIKKCNLFNKGYFEVKASGDAYLEYGNDSAVWNIYDDGLNFISSFSRTASILEYIEDRFGICVPTWNQYNCDF